MPEARSISSPAQTRNVATAPGRRCNTLASVGWKRVTGDLKMLSGGGRRRWSTVSFNVQRLRRGVEREDGREMEPGVRRDEVDATRDHEVEILREELVQLRVVGPQWVEGNGGRSIGMSSRSVVRGPGEQRVAGLDMQRVKRMQVKHRLHVVAAARHCEEPLADLGSELTGVEQHESAVLPPHQRRVRPDVNDGCDLERAANVPEAISDFEHGTGERLGRHGEPTLHYSPKCGAFPQPSSCSSPHSRSRASAHDRRARPGRRPLPAPSHVRATTWAGASRRPCLTKAPGGWFDRSAKPRRARRAC